MKLSHLAISMLAFAACTNTALAANALSEQAAQYQAACAQAKGYFQYGTINSPPNSDYPAVTNFKPGNKLHGVPLSHTHIEITSALDGKVYDVAIDNVFAKDFNRYRREVPASYRRNLKAGRTVYFCGGNPGSEPYTLSGQKFAQHGFDWVHTNCESPNSQFADGWMITENGSKLTNSHKYCYLWNE
ncbi:hypothetical protein ABHF33_15290 [Chitinibacter sp. FCG-7]|uniref:Uncharacterized protein n=1 Tax=Chitinibacter mangrovi TaxID=3153927 RepID=A0AAU7FA76_9NEIS